MYRFRNNTGPEIFASVKVIIGEAIRYNGKKLNIPQAVAMEVISDRTCRGRRCQCVMRASTSSRCRGSPQLGGADCAQEILIELDLGDADYPRSCLTGTRIRARHTCCSTSRAEAALVGRRRKPRWLRKE
jgi:hypothetical protein